MAHSLAVALLACLCANAVLTGAAVSNCSAAPDQRQDCGFVGVDQPSCESKSCCWQPVTPNPGNIPWCFHAVGPSPSPPAPPAPPSPPSPPSPSPPSPSPPAPPPGPPGPLPGCQVFSANQCQGDQIHTDASFEANRWYTPLRGEDDYLPSFQDYGLLVAYAKVVYSDDSLSKATLQVIAQHKDPTVKLSYVLGGVAQASSTATFSTETTGPLTISVKGADGSAIQLDPVDFRWNAPAIKEREGDYRGGQKGAIVELFGWPYADVEQECPQLAAMGYLGVKLFPAMEQVMSAEPFNGVLNPWYFMYQPVSYRLQGRMGTRDELRQLIHTCRSVGVRVYADAVINHMSGGGNDANPHHRNPQAGCTTWKNKTSSLPGGGSSPFYTQDFTYTIGKHTGKQPLQEFPAVPYGPLDFHCERALNSWNDPLILNAGWLTGLTDLDTERENVQERIAAYLTDLMGIGFSGFRVDAAKHIQPGDLVAIFAKVKRNLGGALPKDFFTWLELLFGGEGDMLMCNAASGYNYGSGFTSKLASAGFTADEIPKIKTWNSAYPKETEKGVDDCDIHKSGLQRQVIMNDDHDQQNPGSSSRDMGDAGCVLIKGCAVDKHRGFEVELFTNPPGVMDNKNDFPIRNVLSSFYWGEGTVEGMPDGKSDCAQCVVNCDTCKSMAYQKAHDPTSTGYDQGVGKYTRVHRDQAIVNAMRTWMGLKNISTAAYTSSNSEQFVIL